jgi:CCR4-NOT transcription complex subunit 9
MLQGAGGQHVFSHQQFAEWSQPPHHQPKDAYNPSVTQQPHANNNHYNRMPATSSASTAPSLPGVRGAGAQDMATMNGMEAGVSDEHRQMLEWIAQLMRPETRETALLELSKKREQVPELALILWHSFGKRQ